jgi:hypothetical protein
MNEDSPFLHLERKLPEGNGTGPRTDVSAWPSTAGISRATQEPPEPKVAPVSTEALWLWGRLRDFERDGLLATSRRDVVSTMTDQMRADVAALAPRVAAWLLADGGPRRGGHGNEASATDAEVEPQVVDYRRMAEPGSLLKKAGPTGKFGRSNRLPGTGGDR